MSLPLVGDTLYAFSSSAEGLPLPQGAAFNVTDNKWRPAFIPKNADKHKGTAMWSSVCGIGNKSLIFLSRGDLANGDAILIYNVYNLDTQSWIGPHEIKADNKGKALNIFSFNLISLNKDTVLLVFQQKDTGEICCVEGNIGAKI